MREPSDLELYYYYWETALVDLPKACRFAAKFEDSLSFFDGYSMPFPGFYRTKYTGISGRMKHIKGQFVPVAIWIEQQLGPDGKLIAPEVLMVKSGTWKPIHAEMEGNMLGEYSLLMAWSKCRLNPVTQQMYDFAIESYRLENKFVWHDTPGAPPERPQPIEIKDAASLF